MKKSILLLAMIFTLSTALTSCRETREDSNEVEMRNDDIDNNLEDAGNDIEDAANDVGDEIERGAEEVEDEIE